MVSFACVSTGWSANRGNLPPSKTDQTLTFELAFAPGNVGEAVSALMRTGRPSAS